jgi:hypothetical protein
LEVFVQGRRSLILTISQSHSGGIVAYSEVILGWDFPVSELEIGWEIPASPAKHGIARRIAPDKFYKGSSQEKTPLQWLEFFLLRSPLI